MQTKFRNKAATLLAPVVTASALMMSGRSALAQPFTDPSTTGGASGGWSMIESGPRRGVAIMVFNEDRSLDAFQVITPNARIVVPPTTSGGSGSTSGTSGTDGRGTGGDADRNGGTGSDTNAPPPTTPPATNTLPAHTNLFGWVSFRSDESPVIGDTIIGEIAFHDGKPPGEWDYDINGKIIGFWTEISEPTAATTNLEVIGFHFDPIAQTNVPTFRTNIDFVRLTNAVSFTAKITTTANPINNRMSLLATTPAGRVVFSGLPASIVLTNMSGSGLDDWYAYRTTQGITYTEFFDLLPIPSAPPEWNVYGVFGRGPGYQYEGNLVVTRQKQIGYAVSRLNPESPDKVLVRAVVGTADLRRLRFSGNGWEGLPNATLTPTSVRAFHDPPQP